METFDDLDDAEQWFAVELAAVDAAMQSAVVAGFDRHVWQTLASAQLAVSLFRSAGSPRNTAFTLNTVGWYLAQLGEYEQAMTHCREALAIFDDIGTAHGRAATLDSMGYIHHQLAQHDEAIACYRQALATMPMRS
jgi:Tfp pilus assembly protein PilF